MCISSLKPSLLRTGPKRAFSNSSLQTLLLCLLLQCHRLNLLRAFILITPLWLFLLKPSYQCPVFRAGRYRFKDVSYKVDRQIFLLACHYDGRITNGTSSCPDESQEHKQESCVMLICRILWKEWELFSRSMFSCLDDISLTEAISKTNFSFILIFSLDIQIQIFFK